MTSLSEYAPFLYDHGFIVLVAVVASTFLIYFLNRENKTRRPRGFPKDEDDHVFQDLCDKPSSAEEEGKVQTDDHIPYRPRTYGQSEMTRRSEEFYHLMNERRTCRFFSDKAVSLEIIGNLIKTAGTSPSGAHMQPWTFVVISNKQIKSQIREIIEEEERINYDTRMGDQWVEDLQILKTTWHKPYLDIAPYLVVVFKQQYGIGPDGQRKAHYYSEISTSISVGILLAAIQNAGLVTLTSTPMNSGPRIRHILGRPPNEKVLVLLPIGYPADDATVPNLKRNPLKDIMVLAS